MINNVIKKNLEKILIKHSIKLEDYKPGVLSAKVLDFEKREEELKALLTNIKNDKSVISVKFERKTGMVIINFKSEDIYKLDTLARWKEIFRDYN
ncbi:MAG: hypothetical protein FWF57_06855 [Defluviitaleaceae bacterium]|nr:hypothetical protein [Defluviitaleaceae bacterium]